MKKFIATAIIPFFLLTLSSCGPTHVIIDDRPSAPYRARPASPGLGYVWIDGDWYWYNGRYAYREGYWSRQRGHRVWHGGEWQRRGKGWYWKKGRWH